MKVEIANGRNFNETPVCADEFASGDVVEGILKDYSSDRDTFYVVTDVDDEYNFVSFGGNTVYLTEDEISDWIVARNAKIVVEF